MNELSHVAVALMKGITHREDDEPLWQALLEHQARVRDHVAVLGLELMLDEAEGYAYLRQKPADEAALPRLVARRPLSFSVSLLLALLRKRLAEFDARSGEVRLVVRRDEIVELVRIFLADSGNEARLVDRIDGHVKKVVELGFLRPLRGAEDQFEVSRILKAFVDAQWLSAFEDRLAEYRRHAAAEVVS